WTRCFVGAAGAGTGTGRAVVVDSSGNVFVTGSFRGTIDFGGGPLTSVGWTDIFLAKYSAAGTHLWSKRFGGPVQSFSPTGTAVAVDGGGNVVFTGVFLGTVDFAAGSVTSPLAWPIFVTKYSASGTALWSKTAGGSMTDSGTGVAVDSAGNAVVTGNSSGGMFLMKFTPSGTPVWVKVMG